MPYLINTQNQAKRYLVDDSQVIGRDPACGIVLQDPKVSRRHVVLRRVSGQTYRITDLESRGGCYLNDARITSMELAHGDEIRIGDTYLRFMHQAESTPLPMPAAATTTSEFEPFQLLHDTKRLRRDYERLRAAHEVNQAVGTEQRPEKIARRILNAAFSLLPAERGIVALFKDESTTPFVTVTHVRGHSEERVELSETLVQLVVNERHGMIFSDAVEDERLKLVESIHGAGLRSLICVPLIHEDKVYGVIQLDSLDTSHAFHQDDLDLFSMIAAAAALALANVLLTHTLDDVREQERLRVLRLLTMLPTGLALVSREGHIIAQNPAGERALALLGKFEGPVLVSLAKQPLWRMLEEGTAEGEDYVVGNYTISISVQRDPGPIDDGVLLLLDDVTKVRSETIKKVRADRLGVIGQMASGIAHDFNNLLNVINEGARYLISEATNDELKEEAEAVGEASRRATELVQQLLTFSRRDPVQKAEIDISVVIKNMSQLLARAVGSKHQILFDLAPGLPLITIDPSHVDQMVMNLVVNAKDAMTTPGRVVVRTRLGTGPKTLKPNAPQMVVVEVEDNGGGIPPGIRERIFEPFFSGKPVGQGTGLGLATVHGIVQGMGGDIAVYSEMNVGTRFEITLPCVPEIGRTRDLNAMMKQGDSRD